VGAITGPSRLLMLGTEGEVLQIDPQTGATSASFTVPLNALSITSVGQEIYVGYYDQARVYSRAGKFLRSISVPIGYYGLSALTGWGGTLGAQEVTVGFHQTVNADFASGRKISAAPDSYSTAEDTSLVVPAPGLTQNDSNPDGGDLITIIDVWPTHGNLTKVGLNGAFTYVPLDNYVGPDSFIYHPFKWQITSTPVTVSLQVNSVNDPPSGKNKTLTMLEDKRLTLAAADFGFTDPNDVPANSVLAVKITALPTSGVLFNNEAPVAANDFVPLTDINAGHLQFAPAADQKGTGYATFRFAVQDNGGTMNGGVDLDPAPDTITINVTNVNDAPSGTSNTVTMIEDGSFTFSAADFGFQDPLDGNLLLAVEITTLPSQGVLLNGSANVTAGQFITASTLTSKRLKYVPAIDGNGPGYDAFTFQVQDTGGKANGGFDLDPDPKTMTLAVTAVNDSPSFVGQPVEANDEDGPVCIVAWATAILPGPSNEATQKLEFAVSNVSDPTLFLELPVISDKGDMCFTPRPNLAGDAAIQVDLRDDGGTDNGGVDTFGQSFQITIQKPHAWHNAEIGADVDGNSAIEPVDALLVINYLNDRRFGGPGDMGSRFPAGTPFIDVDGNGALAPLDAITVINQLNTRPPSAPASPAGEGEASLVAMAGPATPTDRSAAADYTAHWEALSAFLNDDVNQVARRHRRS
jgi:hypothetical protein